MHIVVNGQIRHIACYRFLLQRIAEALQAGVAASATLVHWKADEATARELVSAHPGRFELLFIDEPEAPSPGHFFHQAISLQEGMAERGLDDIVLRLRPDIFGMRGFLEAIAGVLQASAKPLWTVHADLTCPFFGNDIVFGGRVHALRAQTNVSMEPYLSPLHRDDPKPTAIYSHEPEIQRWLHPWRDDDWATRCYWLMFPNFGLSTQRREGLLRRFQRWDLFEAVRIRWLRRLLSDVELGGVAHGPTFGLIRGLTLADARVKLIPLHRLNERYAADPQATWEAEVTEYIWTASDRRVAEFLAFCEARAPQSRPLTPAQAHDELAAIWSEVMTEPPGERLLIPIEHVMLDF